LRTLGFFALALLQESGVMAVESSPQPNSIIDLVLRSSPVAKAVLAILVAFSVMSWGIVFFKLWQFHRANRQTATFLDVFRRSAKFSEVQAVCRTLTESPLVGLFLAGYSELNAQLRTPAAEVSAGTAPRPTLRSLDAVDRALLRASGTEVSRLERRVSFLATTASITPFIGLFGTVWGIMAAFQSIGAVGSTNLAVVAPGIAEALIATAAGLFSAIPAVYFYNALSGRVKHFTQVMEDFSLEFLNIAERNFT
jgi:biopolymer transport protein TolQ